MATQPLHEFAPAVPGAQIAAMGFALALATNWSGPAGIVLVGEDRVFAEEGAPYAPGLAQFGLAPERLIVVRAARREEALWAGEQGLALAGAIVVCALSDRGCALDLKATRRLLLVAERHRSRCLLLRSLDETSAAWTRWRVQGAPSQAEARELGAPAFEIELARSRAGPAGARFIVEWNANERRLSERVACDLSAAAGDRSVAPRLARA